MIEFGYVYLCCTSEEDCVGRVDHRGCRCLSVAVHLDDPRAVRVVYLSLWYSLTDENNVVGGVANDESVLSESCYAPVVAQLSDGQETRGFHFLEEMLGTRFRW